VINAVTTKIGPNADVATQHAGDDEADRTNTKRDEPVNGTCPTE
jgi:hypothetical protein